MTGSSNHKHDPERDSAEHTAHDRLLDDLQRSAPAPRPGFAADLETRLVAQLQTKTKTRGRPNPMQTTYRLPVRQDANTNTRRFTIPVTMAAAVLALIVAGALIIAYGMQPPPEDNSAAAPIVQQDESPTPPPTSTGVIVPTTVGAGPFLPTVGSVFGRDVAGGASLRAAPNSDSEALSVVSIGTEVEILGISAAGDWYYVQVDDTAGWMQASLVTVTPTSDPTQLPTTIPVITATPPPTSTGVVVPSPVAGQPTIVPLVTATPVPTTTPVGPGGPAVPVPYGLVPVVIAIEDIPADTPIDVAMLALTYWPDAIVPSDAIDRIELVEGLVFDEPIAQWQPLLLGDLVAGLNAESDDLVAVRLRAIMEGGNASGVPNYFILRIGSMDETRSVLPLLPTDDVDGIELLTDDELGEGPRAYTLLIRREDGEALLDNPAVTYTLIPVTSP